LYAGGAGLTADFCVEVAPESIRAFWSKWNLWEGEPEEPGPDALWQMEEDSPFALRTDLEFLANGRLLGRENACSISWVPEQLLPGEEENPPAAAALLGQYGCSPQRGWVFWRVHCAWATARRPAALKSLACALRPQPRELPGPCFTAAPGQTLAFDHPDTGRRHTLTVVDLAREELSERDFAPGDMEHPRCFAALTYTVEPPLTAQQLRLADTAPADPSRPRAQGKFLPESRPGAALLTPEAAAIGIIGGQDGPTALFVAAGPGRPSAQTACSSLRFEPAESITWRLRFFTAPKEQLALTLLPLPGGGQQS
ncbi:MAG: hypothetical protein IIV90_05785, partial [Oscillospiraceae bacterium]|nr:hypothetical protein [Oscillospiraceae bacterium]